MKKMFLIPMLVIPFFAFPSCAQASDYELSDAARENAIAMVGVDYLQTNLETKAGEETLQDDDTEYSPTVYHNETKNKSSEGDFYRNIFVIKNAPAVYTKYYKFAENLEFIGPKSAIPSDWDDAANFGSNMLDFYREIKSQASFAYNKDEKCYIADLTHDAYHLKFKYHFYKRKLMKIAISTSTGSAEGVQTISCKYDHVTPTPPTPQEN